MCKHIAHRHEAQPMILRLNTEPTFILQCLAHIGFSGSFNIFLYYIQLVNNRLFFVLYFNIIAFKFGVK